MDLSVELTSTRTLIAITFVVTLCLMIQQGETELNFPASPSLSSEGNGKNNVSFCEMVSDDNKSMISGNDQLECQMKVAGTEQFLVEVVQLDMDGTNFLFATQYDGDTDLSSRVMNYVTLSRETYPSCSMILTSNRIQLHMRGRSMVRIYRRPTPDIIAQIQQCDGVQMLDRVHRCQNINIKADGSIETFCHPLCSDSANCVCTLGYRNVTCFNDPNNNVTSATLLVFPKTVTKLKIIANLSQISEESFHSVSNISLLDLSGNKLSVIPDGAFSNLPLLYNLVLERNLLKVITKRTFTGLDNLRGLVLNKNKLETIDSDVFINLTKLETLSLSANNLKSLSPKAFTNLGQVITLYLKENELVHLPDNILCPLHSLEQLSLDYNKLESLPSDVFCNSLSQLMFLTLKNNLISNLPAGIFRSLRNLYLLNLDGNKLTVLNKDSFNGMSSYVTNLMLKNNSIRVIEKDTFRHMTHLEYLYLANNKLETIESGAFMGLDDITYLYLANNFLSEIQTDNFRYLPKLQKLLLDQNQLARLPEDILKLVSLRTLNVSDNNLAQIPQIGKLKQLHYVDLRKNSLVHIKKGTFDGLSNTSEVYVDHEAVCKYVSTENIYKCFGTESVLPFFTGKPLLLSTSLSVFTWILGLAALFGNAFVVVWRYIKQGDEDAVQSALIMNLALSDLLMGMYLLIIASADAHFGKEFPLHSHRWVFTGACDFAGLLSVTSSEASVFFVTLISIDRYIRVVHPHTKYRLRIRSTYVASMIMWSLAFVISLIPLVLKKTNSGFYDMSEVCIGLPLVKRPILSSKDVTYSLSKHPDVDTFINGTYHKGYTNDTSSKNWVIVGLRVMPFSSTVFLAINLVCFLAVLFCYCAIFYVVCKVSKKIKRRGGRDREIKLAARMSVIVLTDCFCWMPIIIMGILVQCGAITLNPVTIAWTVTFVLPVNSSVNPYLYSIIAVVAKQIKEGKDRRSFKLRTSNTGGQTGDTGETGMTLCTLGGIGSKKKSSVRGSIAESSASARNTQTT